MVNDVSFSPGYPTSRPHSPLILLIRTSPIISRWKWFWLHNPRALQSMVFKSVLCSELACVYCLTGLKEMWFPGRCPLLSVRWLTGDSRPSPGSHPTGARPSGPRPLTWSSQVRESTLFVLVDQNIHFIFCLYSVSFLTSVCICKINFFMYYVKTAIPKDEYIECVYFQTPLPPFRRFIIFLPNLRLISPST